ncbi:hypothetical protein AWENTII_005861 [Aspergillus wentii]|nr:hypothetical protein MW887_000244 [Aspergillus wentii]
MTVQNITSLLENAAQDKGILFYPHESHEFNELKYDELHAIAKSNSRIIRSIDGIHEESIILLHFEDHVDNIIWLWSVLYAGCIPAMSIALPKSTNDCEVHLNHLHDLLDDPICLTKSGLLSQFPETKLRIVEIEKLKLNGDQREISRLQQIALLMLSSGSTGQSKAVCLTHQQILASVSGKSAVLPVDRDSFLNWIRLDHVGSLVEIHLHALYLSSNQVHVQAEDIIPNPGWFLELLHRHNVGRTFAPNFFLEDLLAFLERSPPETDDIHLNHLRYLVSGGEANSTQTCHRLSTLLTRYGVPPNAIVPGFGMTETCAGCIYNKQCPEYDIQQQNEFVSLGECTPGIEMRITSPDDDERAVGRQVIGNLQLRGDIVFSSYFNNEPVTSDAFASNGWFKTGDVGIIDAAGKLNLVGRTKDVITINGLKYHPNTIEAAIEDAEIDGVRPGCVSCFAYRSSGATEAIYVVYLPAYPWDDAEARYNTRNSIIQRVLLLTNSLPYILPLDPDTVERTTMGKISRSKLSTALQNGHFQKYEAVNALKLEEAEAEKY